MLASDRFAKSTCLLRVRSGVPMHIFYFKWSLVWQLVQNPISSARFAISTCRFFIVCTCTLWSKMWICTLPFLPSMASTKKSTQRHIGGIPAKSPRTPSSRNYEAVEPKPHRYRWGARAQMEFRKWHCRESERLLIHRLPFARLVRKIAENYMAAPSLNP